MAESAQNPRVLVVDDEPNIRELVQVALNFHGCAVTTGATGQDALQLAAFDPDLIVLDVMLPDIDGFEVLPAAAVGGNDVPVIFLTARDATVGHRHRADDRRRRLHHQAVLGRGPGRAGARGAAPHRAPGRPRAGAAEAAARTSSPPCASPTWSSTRTTGRSAAPGIPVELSPTEFRLLAYLMRNQGLMLTRRQLLDNVWGWEYAGQSQVLETYVSYLRRKLDPLGPPLIHTQRGVGYSLRPPG